MEIMLIILAVLGSFVIFTGYVQYRGKLGAEYLGYFWEITAVKKGKKRTNKVKIQAVDVRQQLMYLCQIQEPTMLEVAERQGGNPVSWETTRLYITAPRNYQPSENDQAPATMYLYAQIIADMEDSEWEVKSIEQVGWRKVRPEQVLHPSQMF